MVPFEVFLLFVIEIHVGLSWNEDEDFAVKLLFLDGNEAMKVWDVMFKWLRCHKSWGRRQVMRLPRPADHLHRSQPPIQPPAPAGLV